MTDRTHPTGSDLCDLTTAVAAVHNGHISCAEMVELHLEHVRAVNPTVNALVTVDEKAARRQARHLDRERAAGRLLPLHGTVMTVKDTITTAALRTTAGSEELSDYLPDHDAPVVARLRHAGAIILGKTNVPKLAGDLQTHNPVFGTTNNPWDLTRTPGGSSGGAAAAVATGMSTADIGSDHAGSLSLPAHSCGVFAHKPTYGTVPTSGHIPPLPGSHRQRDLTVIGPIARSGRDLKTLLHVMTSTSPSHASPRAPTTNAAGDDPVATLRLAAWIDDPYLPLDSDVADTIRRGLANLTDAGVHVDEHARPDFSLEQASRLGLQLLAAEAATGYSPERFDGVIEFADALPPHPPDALSLMARSLAMRHRDWIHLDERRYELIDALARFFERYDALLAPVSPVVAPPHDPDSGRLGSIQVNGTARSHFDQIAWPAVISMAHLPATTVPVGVTRSGLPVGVQIVGPRFADATTLVVARHVEQICGGYRPPPIRSHHPAPPAASAPQPATGMAKPDRIHTEV